MKYKGIEYKVLSTTTKHVWAWWVTPPKSIPIHGKSNSLTGASEAAKRAINNWLKSKKAELNC